MKGVKTNTEFKEIWKQIKKETDGTKDYLKIKGMHIFTHSNSSRLYLFDNMNMTAPQIEKLERLNWMPAGTIVLHGCRSGKDTYKQTSVARAFADTQRVVTFGQDGFSQFSTNPNKRTWLSREMFEFQDVYLWSYGDGGYSHTFGDARDPVEVKPGMGMD